MSYYKSPAINEDRMYETELYDDLSESYFEASVHYHYHEWSEGHPYGETTAYERLSETEIQWYELEGDEVSREDLVLRFGEDQVKEMEQSIE